MKGRSLAFILMSMCIVVPAVVLIGQTNTRPPLILPPADWDAGKHILASFVATNRPGDYPLQFDWVGVERVTACTGWYATDHEKATQKSELLKFDGFTVTLGPLLPRMREDRYLWNGERRRMGPAYRRSLPTDTELLQMHDVGSVSNFFGWNPFTLEPTNGTASAVGIGYFTLRPYDSIETLQVTVLKRIHEPQIESILVKRAVLHPQSRNP